MSSSRKDMLFELVRSLSKAEKRHFKIYAKRINYNGQVLFLDLFNYLEKQQNFNLQVLLNNLPTINERQLSNVKRSLYNHILSSLSLLYGLKKPSLKIRSYMNYAELLYARGLYLQSLKILLRAKKIAVKSHNEELHLEIIIQEQKIQSRHITRSTTSKMKALIEEADQKLKIKVSISKLSNLKLYLQRQFINHGPDLKPQLISSIQDKLDTTMKAYEFEDLSLFEKVYYNQCYYWLNYLRQDFEKCYDYAKRCDELFILNPSMLENDFDLFLICKHHYLNMLFFTGRFKLLAESRNCYKVFIQDNSLNLNSFILANLFNLLVHCDYNLSKEQPDDNSELIYGLNNFLELYANRMDSYKINIIHYKLACLSILNRNFDEAIGQLNVIINSSNPLREEIVCYARLLLIFCYIEIQNEESALYFTVKTKRYIQASTQSNQFMMELVNFYNQLLKTKLLERTNMVDDFFKSLESKEHTAITNRNKIFIAYTRHNHFRWK